MGEDHASEVKIKTVLNASGNRAEAHGEPDTKDEFQLSGRDATRFSLQSVALTVTPSAATANLAIPVTLYSRSTPPEESDTAALDEALATLSPAAPKSVTEAIARLQAHFDHPAFQADAFDLHPISSEAGLTLNFDRPLPSLDTHVLELIFTDGAQQNVVITVTDETQEEDADAESTEEDDTPSTDAAPESVALKAVGETLDLSAPQIGLSALISETADPIVSLELASGPVLPETIFEPVDEIATVSPLPETDAPNDDINDAAEETVPSVPDGFIVQGDRFGAVELDTTQPSEKIYLSDVDANAVEARFVRDANGVKFLVTLDGVAESAASLYGYVPLGWDVTVFDREGAPVHVPDAVFVYEAANNIVQGGAEDNVLLGGAAAESLRGRGGDDLIYGGAGSDKVNAGRGDDIIDGGAGNDELKGGPGQDSYLFSGTDFGADLIVDYEGGEAIHLLDVAADDVYARYVEDESGVYLLISIHSRPEASANIRVDSLPGMNVPLFAQDGAAIEITDQVYTFGTPGTDYIYLGEYEGRNEDNIVYAGDGDDAIVDYDGENHFYGEGGDDLIIGGEGVDHIIGGTGNDSLSGYHGGDIFIFTGDRFGHDTIWDYESEDVVVLSDLDIGNVRARFEVQSGLLQFKVLVGEEAQWTASIQFYDAPRLQSEQINILLDNDVPLITDEALHHLGGAEQNIHIGQDGVDVFHIGKGEPDIVRGFDVAQDRLGLDVSDALLSQVSALSDNDAKLALLGDELGLSFDNSASLTTGTSSNDAAQTDTAVTIAGEVALILEDTEDEFDFTQLDIY